MRTQTSTRMRTKTKKTKTGSRRGCARARLVAAAILWLCVPAILLGGKDKHQDTSYALVAGTVFQESGLSLPGVEVELAVAGQPEDARKFKKMKQVTDARGEFAFRVPNVAAEYKVSVKAAHYQGQEKRVSVTADERVDVFFSLEPASNR